MRKQFLLMPCTALFIFILFSCRKENTDPGIPQNFTNEKLISKVKSWLDEQKNDIPIASAGKIDSLKSNLNYGEMRLEKYKGSKEFIVIPILSGLKLKNNSDKNPANYLVMTLENQDSITKGNIIQYISSNSLKLVPKNTFYKMFTFQDLDCSGQFTVLSVTDYFRYELKVENGKLKSLIELKKNADSKNGTARVNDCIDWYWQTWYVWSDGSVTLESEVYAFTTCDGDCAQARIANGRSVSINCNGQGAGGGYDSGECPTTPQQGQAALSSVTSTILFNGISQTGPESAPDANGIIERAVVVKRDQIRYVFPGGRTATYTLYFPGVLFKTTTNSQWKWKQLAFSYIGLSEGNPGCFSVTFTQAVVVSIDPDKLNARFTAAITAELRVSCLGGFVISTKPEFLSGVYPASDF